MAKGYQYSLCKHQWVPYPALLPGNHGTYRCKVCGELIHVSPKLVRAVQKQREEANRTLTLPME